MSTLEGSDALHPGWEPLLEWLAQHGMNVNREHLAVECRASTDAGYGLYSTLPVPDFTYFHDIHGKPGALLLKIPPAAMMNIKTLAPMYSSDGKRPALSAVQLLTLHLFLHRPREAAEHSDSLFGPYIYVLPVDFDSHPLAWLVKRRMAKSFSDPVEGLLAFLPPNVSTALVNLAQRFDDDFDTVCNYLSKNLSHRVTELYGTNGERLNIENPGAVDNFLWAWLNVNTRCVYHRLTVTRSDPDNVTMVPIVDLANHTPAPAHLQPMPSDADIWDTAPRGKHGEAFGLRVPLGLSVKAGDELFLQYGKHANRTLFVEYGFVNPFAVLQITDGEFAGEVDVQDLVEDIFRSRAAVGEWMREVLVNEGYWGDWTMHSHPPPAYPSYRLISALRLLHIVPESTASVPEELRDRLLQLWRNTVLGRAALISTENESSWRETLSKMCTTLEQRGHAQMRALGEIQIGMDGMDWRDWARGNIWKLWEEEVEVAKAVRMSVEDGLEF